MTATAAFSAVEIIGHRGASYDAPENTLASVNLAWQRNADAVEIDIYLTKDGKIVAYHDKTTKRIGGRDQAVNEQTLAELQTLDVGAWKNEKYKEERIPTLTQILKAIPAGKRLFIEIKCGPEVLP
ncbi:MAG: glycerophosphodiester phosphodiesterase, partial [Planctomycetaceae bacterium]|nr:glycerophosphodiester phosphodiesterase [Planctomycetaceae bacterium]